jgi:hypothetical protein
VLLLYYDQSERRGQRLQPRVILGIHDLQVTIPKVFLPLIPRNQAFAAWTFPLKKQHQRYDWPNFEPFSKGRKL